MLLTLEHSNYVTAFKYYECFAADGSGLLCKQAIMALEEGITVKEFWSKCNIPHEIKNIVSGW